MDINTLQGLLANLLEQSGHPNIVSTQVLPSSTVQVNLVDGSTIYTTIAHTGGASTSLPERPTWPTVTTRKGRAV